MKLRVISFNIQHGAPVPENHRDAVRAFRVGSGMYARNEKGEDTDESSKSKLNGSAEIRLQEEESTLSSIESIAHDIRTLGADIVCLQEVDHGRERSGYVNQAREIADVLGFYYVFAPARGHVVQRFARGNYPRLRRVHKLNRIACRKRKLQGRVHRLHKADTEVHRLFVEKREYGVAILSRYPIRAVKLLRLPDAIEVKNDDRKTATLRSGLTHFFRNFTENFAANGCVSAVRNAAHDAQRIVNFPVIKVPEPRICVYAAISLPDAEVSRRVDTEHHADAYGAEHACGNAGNEYPALNGSVGEASSARCGKKREIVVACAHLAADSQWSPRQLEAALGGFDHLVPRSVPALLAGDFNMSVADVDEFLASGRRVDTSVTHVLPEVSSDRNFRPMVSAITYPNWAPKAQIDHILGRNMRAAHCGEQRASRAVQKLHCFVSDHAALVADISIDYPEL